MAIAAAAIYGPFVLAAVYAAGFVSSSHAKTMTWKLLPAGPGLLPVEALRRLFDLPRLGDTLWLSLAVVTSLGFVALLAVGVRRGGWVRPGALIVTTVAAAAAAYAMLSMLQS